MWEIGPIRPIVAPTADSASSSGTPAATRAPKAITRITRVMGSDVTSAVLKSSSNDLEMALLALASPNSSIRREGWAFCAAATADSALSTFLPAASSSPGILKFTSAERRFFEMAASLR